MRVTVCIVETITASLCSAGYCQVETITVSLCTVVQVLFLDCILITIRSLDPNGLTDTLLYPSPPPAGIHPRPPPPFTTIQQHMLSTHSYKDNKQVHFCEGGVELIASYRHEHTVYYKYCNITHDFSNIF